MAKCLIGALLLLLGIACTTGTPLVPGPTSTAMPTPGHTPTAPPALVPTPVLVSEATPTSTPVPTLADLRELMLALINEARAEQGLTPVALGNNPAAQAHAQDIFENCYLDHWNMEGIKGGARYSFAGGYQANGENVHGSSYCPQSWKDYATIDLREEVQEAMDGWMDSPGHRATMLDAAHRKVNIGLAWHDYHMYAVQQFEGDYIEYVGLPHIEDGTFAMEGSLRGGAQVDNAKDLDVVIHHDPLPTRLTVGQLARTYGVGPGLRAADLRPPPSPGASYTSDRKVLVREYHRRPHDISPDLPSPRSYDESRALALDGRKAPKRQVEVTTHLVTADVWDVDTDTGTFRVVADLSDVLDDYGPGIYEVVVFALVDGQTDIVSEYTILWEG